MKLLLSKPDGTKLFPCPVCGDPREVKLTKKGKPYIICDRDGMQMFVRVGAGIQRFDQLVKDAADNNIWKQIAELRKRYQHKCPKCGTAFWLKPELIRMKPLTRMVMGIRCPVPGCDGLVTAEEAGSEKASSEEAA